MENVLDDDAPDSQVQAEFERNAVKHRNFADRGMIPATASHGGGKKRMAAEHGHSLRCFQCATAARLNCRHLRMRGLLRFIGNPFAGDDAGAVLTAVAILVIALSRLT